LQCFDNEHSRFYTNVIIFAFAAGSGEEDTTASSFTTSAEEPLETTYSEMTGLLLEKISFSFCQRAMISKLLTLQYIQKNNRIFCWVLRKKLFD